MNNNALTQLFSAYSKWLEILEKQPDLFDEVIKDNKSDFKREDFLKYKPAYCECFNRIINYLQEE